ncbi:MAG: kelch repeat-containing protein [Planctomycetota bacterium]
MSGGRGIAISVIALGTLASTQAGGGERWTYLWYGVPLQGESPEPRFAYGAAADEMCGRLFVFGGDSASGLQNDLWSFDPAEARFEKLEPAALSPLPPPRASAITLWIPERAALLVYGGRGEGALQDDAWTFDFPTRWWHRLEPPPGEKPIPREGSAGAYDPEGRQAFLFGGLTREAGVARSLGDTWRLDLETGRWHRLGDGPRERTHAALLAVPGGGRILLLGGEDVATGELLGDAWLLDTEDGTWSSVGVPGTEPVAARRSGAIAVFADEDRVLLVMGRGCRTELPLPVVMSLDLSTGRWSPVDDAGWMQGHRRPPDRWLSGGSGLYGRGAGERDRALAGLFLFAGLADDSGSDEPVRLGDVWLLRPL